MMNKLGLSCSNQRRHFLAQSSIGRYNALHPSTLNTNRNSELLTKKSRIKAYLAVPYHPNLSSTINAVLSKSKINNIRISPRISVKNRSHVFTNLKDKRKMNNVINAFFRIKCRQCN